MNLAIMSKAMGDVGAPETNPQGEPKLVLHTGIIQYPDKQNHTDTLGQAIGRMQKEILEKQARGEEISPEIIAFAKRPTENIIANLRNSGYSKDRGSFDNVRPGDELRLLRTGSLILTTSGARAASYPIYNINKPKADKGDSFSPANPELAPEPKFIPPAAPRRGPSREELEKGPIA